jgi:FG-GAP repeat
MSTATTASATKPTSTQPISYTEIVLGLKRSYLGPARFLEGHMSLPSKSMKNNSFLGSSHVVFLSSQSSMEHDAPACIAAPLVNMVAKNAISIGAASKTPADKVVIYAPEQLSLTTNHLTIGNIAFLANPKAAFISCSKLTLIKFEGEDPDYFKVVKSWVIDNKAKVDTVVKPLPKATSQSIGDLNTDGLDDLVLGAPNVAPSAGAAYVIFGQAGATKEEFHDAPEKK